MEKMRNRLLSSILVFAMVISWIPGNFLQAEAAEATKLYGDSTGWTVWNGEAFPTTGEHHYKLAGNVDLADIGVVKIPANVTVAIDLCGYRILAQEGSRSLSVSGTLIIQDSSKAQTGQVVGSTTASTGGNIYMPGTKAVFALYSGTLTGGNAGTRGGNVYINGGTFNMYGGTVTGGESPEYGGNLYVTNNGSIHISGGKITGGDSKRGGNVGVMYSNFTLSGGEISGGTANSGENIIATGSSEKHSNLVITGGTVCNGGILADGSVSGGTATAVRISGGTLACETYIKGAVSCTLSGAPVVQDLHLASNMLLTPTDLTEGASIAVRTDSSDKILSGIVRNPESCVGYFRAADAGSGVSVANGKLVLVEGCPCGCGVANENINWIDLNTYLSGLSEAKAGYIEESGHYYLSAPLDLTGMPTLEIYADVILDLHGYTITPEKGHRTVYVNKNCSLSLYDTVGGGKLMGSRVDSNGGAIYVGSNAVFRLYSGTVTGGAAPRGGNIYNNAGVVYIHGGTVSNGTADNTLGTANNNGRGGNIFSLKDVYITGGTVTGGTTEEGSSYGGNIYMTGQDATLYISGSARITKGSAKRGGNICALYCTVDISGGTVSGGTATNYGNDIYTYGDSDTGPATFKISGGSVSGNIYLSGPEDNKTVADISGGNLKGETYAHGVQSLMLTGTPVIKNLRLPSGTRVTPEGLVDGASITVDARDVVISNACENAAQQAKYFKTAQLGSAVAAVDGVLQITAGCPCGCETALEQITWLDWSGEAITKSGHYRPSGSFTLGSTVTIAAGLDVVLDLYGQQVTAPASSCSFKLKGRLSILDSVGNGSLVGGTIEADGGNIYMYTGAELDLYSGTITGGTAGYGGNIYMEGGTFNMYGGTVAGGTASRGGNIYLTKGTVRVSGGEVTGGTASWGGGNLFVTGMSNAIYISGGTVSGGSTKNGGICSMYGNLYISGGAVGDDIYLTRQDNKYSALYITGGAVSGAITAAGVNYSGASHVMVISGGNITGAINIKTAKALILSGAPVVTDLTLESGVLITPVELSAEADITITNAAGVFTTALEDAESYKTILKYSGSEEYIVYNDALALFGYTASGTCGSNLTWTLTNTGVLIISGTGDMSNVTNVNNVPWSSYKASITEVVIQSGVTSIGAYAFYNCKNLKSITIADTVTSIGRVAFNGCTALTGVVLPNALTSLGEYAFDSCTSLESIVIPDGITSIGLYTFRHCTSLKEVTLPKSLTSIGMLAFYSCDALECVYYEGTEAQWDAIEISYLNTSLTNLVAAGGIRYDYVAGNVGGSNVYWTLNEDSTLTIYGTGAMSSYYYDTAYTQYLGTPWQQHADQITAVKVESGVTSVGNWAFYGLTNVTSVTLADSVTRIGDHAFRGCTALTEINLDSVEVIGRNAFQDCTGLTAVNCGGAQTLCTYAFYGCTGLTAFTVPATLSAIGEHAFDGCAALTAFTVGAGNTAYASDDSGALYNVDMTTLVRAPSGITGSFTVPESVTAIGAGAFAGCDKLTEVILPDTVTELAAAAFDGCAALQTVTLGSDTASIGNNAFANCGSLTAIIVPADNASFASDEAGALYNKDMTTLMQVPGGIAGSYQVAETVTTVGQSAFASNKGITEVTLPSSVTTVEKWAFSCNENLAKITLPNSVTSIPVGAFEHTGLADVYYQGGNSQWAAIKVENYNEPLLVATVHHLLVDKGTSNSISWNLTSDGVLTFSGTGELKNYTAYDMPWYPHREMITQVVFSEGITSVGSNILNGCAALTEVTIPASVTAVGDDAFAGCEALTDVYYSGSWTQWNTLTVGEGNEQLGVAVIHYAHVGPVSITVTTPAVKTEYYLNEMLDTTGLILTVLYGDDSTQQITEGYDVSYDFTLPGTRTVTVTYLQMQTTYEVTVIPGGSCGEDLRWLFDEETGILTVTGTGAMTDYNAETPAPWSTFAEQITALVLDEGITAIGANAFCSCIGLKEVTYGGTAKQWEAVTIADGNDPLAAATLTYAVLLGDVNDDGKINLVDVMKTLQYYKNPTTQINAAADVNGDGKINLVDVMKILQHYKNPDVPLGV